MQPLVEQAHPIRIVPKQLHSITATSAEDVKLTGEGIGRQCRLHQSGQAVDPTAQVRKTGYQPDPYPSGQAQHWSATNKVRTARQSR